MCVARVLRPAAERTDAGTAIADHARVFCAAAAATAAVRVLHARYGVLHGSIWYGLTLFWTFFQRVFEGATQCMGLQDTFLHTVVCAP